MQRARVWFLVRKLRSHIPCSGAKKKKIIYIKKNKVFLCVLSGEGNDTPLQYSCLESPMDRGAWWAAVHGVTKSRTRLSDFTFTFHFHALEEEMATHSRILAWRIPGTGEPGGLPSMGSHRVGHDWSDLAAVAAACVLRKVTLRKLPPVVKTLPSNAGGAGLTPGRGELRSHVLRGQIIKT